MGVVPDEWFEKQPPDYTAENKEIDEQDLAPSSYEPPEDEPEDIHQKMYEIATTKYNPFAVGGSENIQDFNNVGGSGGTQMKDQASVGKESASVKYQRALDLFTESVMKPDPDLRGCAYNQGCYDDLMEIREHVLEYLKTLKEVTHHTNPDESDEIESAKLMSAKQR